MSTVGPNHMADQELNSMICATPLYVIRMSYTLLEMVHFVVTLYISGLLTSAMNVVTETVLRRQER